MRHSDKKMLWIIGLSISFSLIITVIGLISKDSLLGATLGDYKTTIINNAPVYSYENRKTLDSDSANEIIKSEPTVGEQYGSIECDRVKLRCPLYLGDYDSIFEEGAGTNVKYALPGNKGTALIGGHDTTFFAPLEKIKVGDELVVDTIYGNYTFVVTDISVAKVDEFKADTQKDEAKLVLYTCYPFGNILKEREERYYVYAQKK